MHKQATGSLVSPNMSNMPDACVVLTVGKSKVIISGRVMHIFCR